MRIDERAWKTALLAGVVYAAAEYPLGETYPLAKPIDLSTRMAVAGGLAIVSVLVAEWLLGEKQS